jgi:hypothetical protein
MCQWRAFATGTRVTFLGSPARARLVIELQLLLELTLESEGTNSLGTLVANDD